MLHNEEKEFQIRLAELQADIQILLTSCFGMLALFFAILIGSEQTLFILGSEQYALKVYFLIAIAILAVMAVLTTRYYVGKIQVARKQISELRKEYCW